MLIFLMVFLIAPYIRDPWEKRLCNKSVGIGDGGGEWRQYCCRKFGLWERYAHIFLFGMWEHSSIISLFSLFESRAPKSTSIQEGCDHLE